jgi:hypothetical protein
MTSPETSKAERKRELYSRTKTEEVIRGNSQRYQRMQYLLPLEYG